MNFLMLLLLSIACRKMEIRRSPMSITIPFGSIHLLEQFAKRPFFLMNFQRAVRGSATDLHLLLQYDQRHVQPGNRFTNRPCCNSIHRYSQCLHNGCTYPKEFSLTLLNFQVGKLVQKEPKQLCCINLLQSAGFDGNSTSVGAPGVSLEM